MGGAVAVLLGLVMYMVYGRGKGGKEQIEVVEEEEEEARGGRREEGGGGEEYDDGANYYNQDESNYSAMHEEHQRAIDSFEQQKEEDDFRERESGGVDALYNPMVGYNPPPLPAGPRRITLQRPKAMAIQQHFTNAPSEQGSVAPSGSPGLPAARRITIIAKPPIGSQQHSAPSLIPPPPPRSASPSQLPPVASFKPVYGKPHHYGDDL